MVSPSFAEDVTSDDPAGNPPAAETPQSDPVPQPEPAPDPEPEAEEQVIPDDVVPAGEEAQKGARLITKTAALDLDPVFDLKQVVVCKYSKTPGIGEEDQTVNISSISVLPADWIVGKFPAFFTDAQGFSVSPRYAYEGENTNDVAGMINELCPPYVPPGVVVAPQLTVNDPCGLDNASYGPVPTGNYIVTPNLDGTFPYSYTDGDSEIKLLMELEPGEDPANLDAVLLCGTSEVGGHCEDASDEAAVDGNGDLCFPEDEVGGIIETASLPTLVGPRAGWCRSAPR